MFCKTCGHIFEEGDDVSLLEVSSARWKEPEPDVTYPEDKEWYCADCAFMR